MRHFALVRGYVLAGMVLCLLGGRWLAPAGAEDEPTTEGAPEAKPIERFTVEAARSRALLMHKVYASTLETMHRHYFHANKSVLPARAMEDVFADLAHEEQVNARWIAVNTKAMSIDHEPATEFEKKAAQRLSAGKEEHAEVEGGYYRRAAPIPLSAGCIHCHVGGFSNHKTPRYAGLVISIPVKEDK